MSSGARDNTNGNRYRMPYARPVAIASVSEVLQ